LVFYWLKIAFSEFALALFPHNPDAVSEQQAERFHQHINETEGRCQVGWMLT
jgi:hypothetical protein